MARMSQGSTGKPETVDFRVSDASVWRIRFPDLSEGRGSKKARPAWTGCGRADRSAIPLYALGRETRRRPKTCPALRGVAAAFFEPNTITLPCKNIQDKPCQHKT